MRALVLKILACGVCALACAAGALAQNLSFKEIERLPVRAADHRVAYGRDPLQYGELRLPKGRGPHPVAVVVHGGCWLSQYTVSHVRSFAGALTDAGFATWAVEYRRVGDAGGGWPGTFEDLARGVDHLRALAREHRLDLGRVVFVGHSAGGQLALWLAARPRLPKSAELYTPRPLRPRGVVSLAGINDMRAFGAGCDDAVSKFLGGPPASFAGRYRQASPAELLPLGVPQWLIHGTLDSIVPLEQSKTYAAAAGRKGDAVRVSVLGSAGHFDLIAPGSTAWPTVKEAVLALAGRGRPRALLWQTRGRARASEKGRSPKAGRRPKS